MGPMGLWRRLLIRLGLREEPKRLVSAGRDGQPPSSPPDPFARAAVRNRPRIPYRPSAAVSVLESEDDDQ